MMELSLIYFDFLSLIMYYKPQQLISNLLKIVFKIRLYFLFTILNKLPINIKLKKFQKVMWIYQRQI